MAGPIGAADNLARSVRQVDNAATEANRVLAANRSSGTVNIEGVANEIAALRQSNPEAARQVTVEVQAQLTPVQRGQLQAQFDQAGPAPAGPSRGELVADLTQIGLDFAGIFDPTPISDGANGVISLFRGDFLGAGISAVSMIPYVGDAAKLGKLGKWAETVANAAELAVRDPGFRQMAQPALERLQSAFKGVDINSLPLPQSAKDQLTAMQRSLDEALGGGTRQTTRTFTNADDFNRAANNATPNTRYEFGNYAYQTDELGRVSVSEGTISLAPTGRNDPTLQRQIGNEGRSTDVGFHIIADRFGGQTNRLNVVQGNGVRPAGDPNPNLNTGAWKSFENQLARLAENPANRVEVRVQANYADGNTGVRPDDFVAQYRVNGGRWVTQAFVNK